jgi:hypothetical protein
MVVETEFQLQFQGVSGVKPLFEDKPIGET